MLFRLVRPMKRDGSRFHLYVRRIPTDLRSKLVGWKLNFPLGDATHPVTITSRTQSIRFSLRTDDPAEVKARVAAADQYFDRIIQAFRDDEFTALTNRQATALSKRLYLAWAGGEGRERTIAVEQGADGKMHQVPHDPGDDAAYFEATLQRLLRVDSIGKHEMDKPRETRKPYDLGHPPRPDEVPDAADLEVHLGPLVDRLLLSEGLRRVDTASRGLLLRAFWLALRDALAARQRNAQSDYSPDPNANRFPEWTPPQGRVSEPPSKDMSSLTGLVDGWWREAQALGLSDSTKDSYERTFKGLAAFLKHDDAGRVTEDDIIAFKDHRLATPHPHLKGKNISGRTVRDSDLAGLKSVFGWAVTNRKIKTDPAKNVKMRKPRKIKLRDKWFTEPEAKAILKAALGVEQGRTAAETYAAKRWVPWLMAYSGARVGEVVQLRKRDLHREGEHHYIVVTPEAGAVKTKEARKVVLHPHLLELGFVKFVSNAPGPYLFLRPAEDGDVSGPRQGVKNRLQEFTRSVIADRNVKPNHGWRDTFKKNGLEAGMDRVVVNYISGWTPTTVTDREYPVETAKMQAAELAKFPRYDVT